MNFIKHKVEHNKRFNFGKNWKKYSLNINDDTIIFAENSLKNMLRLENLKGKDFIDVGCGSGLFSLAARRLGASVISFDFDKNSIESTLDLKNKFFNKDDRWQIYNNSILNKSFLESLGKFDIIYSWGVLHHTGSMWEALENLNILTKKNSLLFIALYNDKGNLSKFWKFIKKTYVNSPFFIKFLIIVLYFLRKNIKKIVLNILQFNFSNIFKFKIKRRGMSSFIDLVDWVGGYPYEYTSATKVKIFYENKYDLIRLNETQGLGNNEFVFIKK